MQVEDDFVLLLPSVPRGLRRLASAGLGCCSLLLAGRIDKYYQAAASAMPQTSLRPLHGAQDGGVHEHGERSALGQPRNA